MSHGLGHLRFQRGDLFRSIFGYGGASDDRIDSLTSEASGDSGVVAFYN